MNASLLMNADTAVAQIPRVSPEQLIDGHRRHRGRSSRRVRLRPPAPRAVLLLVRLLRIIIVFKGVVVVIFSPIFFLFFFLLFHKP